MNQNNYKVQLDGLRFFAVLFVAWHHWAPKEFHYGIPWNQGVYLFFVLSGFLITGILLKSKEAAENKRTTKLFTWRQFYIRRFLRIFPLYYFVLLVAFILHAEQYPKTFIWHISYLSNYHFFNLGYFDSLLSHFWTLAVEEQFYLFWPFLIIMIPKKYLIPAITGVILIAPIHRIYMGFDYYSSGVYGILTVDCLDYLGMGALLAIIRSDNKSEFLTVTLVKRFKPYIGWCTFLVFIILMVIMALGKWNYKLSGVMGTVVSILFAFLIAAASRGIKGVVGKILSFTPIVYLGKISYGIYIYHLFAKIFVPLIFSLFSAKHLIENNLALYLFSMGIWTVIVASASWYFYEKPINNLKNRFPYF